LTVVEDLAVDCLVGRSQLGILGKGRAASARSCAACSSWTSLTNCGFDKNTALLLDVEYLDTERLTAAIS
jgi:hypothetical protein